MLSPTAVFVKAFGHTASLLAAQLRANKARYSSANKSFPHRQEIRIIDGKDLNSGSAKPVCPQVRLLSTRSVHSTGPSVDKRVEQVRLCSDQCRLCSNLCAVFNASTR